MRSRTKTLGQNLAVYALILLVVGVNAWFWGTHVGTKGEEIAELEKEIEGLARLRMTRESELSDAENRVADFSKEIARRRKELEEYGEFLPSLDTRPQVQKFILRTIEDLGIRIQKTDEIKLTPRRHYSKLEMKLSLKGTYRDFKLLLARVYKSEQFIRITRFDLLTLDDAEHMQSATIAFETYFSNS